MRRLPTPVLALVASTALATGLAACSSDAAAPPPATTATWRVCTDVPYAPFEVEGDGPRGLRYTGFDIEVLDAVARARNARLRIVPADFDTALRDVVVGRCDVVASAVPINRERRQQVAFAKAYFDADQSLLVRAGSKVTELADLEDATIGVQAGTLAEWWIRRRLPRGSLARSYPDASSLQDAVRTGKVDAALADLAVNTEAAQADPDLALVARVHTGERFGFAVAPDDDALRAELDAGLEAIRADGTFDRIHRRYFPYPTEDAHG